MYLYFCYALLYSHSVNIKNEIGIQIHVLCLGHPPVTIRET